MAPSPFRPDARGSTQSDLPGAGTVPLFVDASIASGQRSIVRCSYLTIETADPAPDWSLTIAQWRMPILLLGLGAIVLEPVAGGRFRQPSDFDDLVRLVEEGRGLSLEAGDVWLPSDMFRSAAVEAGQVYRVSQPLFTIGLKYRNGTVEFAEFQAVAHDHFDGLELSSIETLAFQQWHAAVLERPPVGKNSELRLRDRRDL